MASALGVIRSRKGVGAVVETILLVGLAVTTGILVFTWSKGFTKELTEQNINFVEGKLECEEIFLNLIPKNACSTLNITNKGRLPISQLAVRVFDSNGNLIETKVEKISLSSNPEKNNMEISGFSPGASVEIIPIAKIKNELIGCKEKGIKKEC